MNKDIALIILFVTCLLQMCCVIYISIKYKKQNERFKIELANSTDYAEKIKADLLAYVAFDVENEIIRRYHLFDCPSFKDNPFIPSRKEFMRDLDKIELELLKREYFPSDRHYFNYGALNRAIWAEFKNHEIVFEMLCYLEKKEIEEENEQKKVKEN